jgi:histone H3/H4
LPSAEAAVARLVSWGSAFPETQPVNPTMARPTQVKKEDKDAAKKFPGDKAAPLIVAGAKKRKRRKPSGNPKYKRRAVREIKALAKRTKPMIPHAVYNRICRDMANDSALNAGGVRWQDSAIRVVAVAAEAHVEAVMSRANMLTGLCGKETLTADHIKAALAIMTEESNGHCTVRA